MQIDKPFVNEPAVVVGHGFGKSGKKGTPYIWFDFELTDQPMLSDGSFEKIRGEFYLTPKTLSRAIDTLHTLGFVGDDLRELDPMQPGHHDFKGFQTHITTKIDEYNGRIRQRVERVGKYETELSPTELAEVSERFKAEIMFNKHIGGGQ